MSAAAPAVAVRDVSKVYRRSRRRPHGTLKSALLSRRGGSEPDGVVALDRVSFELEEGQALGVIGANGSGKSTLLKLLAGIVRPTSGTVQVRGRLAALLELGAGFHPEISGRENIEITGLLLGLGKKEIARRFDSIVAFAGIEEFLDEPVKNYSSGMSVRLGFAIAAHADPDVLLVDEVLAVGDEAFSHRALEKFSEFERQGRTLVFVSHDLPLVADRCRRAIYLERGRIAADGPSGEVVARYRGRVAAAEGERRLGAPSGEARIGSGAASIESIQLLGPDGRPAGRLESGEPAALEMSVRTREPLSDFVFGFQISTVAGAAVLATNTAIDGFVSERLGASARVRLRIPSLDLAPGTYALDAAVHARDGAPHDYRRDARRFEVTSRTRAGGVWNPRRGWEFEGDVAWRTK